MVSATHAVVRSFPGPGGLLSAGAEVDASRWRNTELLVAQRFLRPIGQPAVVPAGPAPIDEQAIASDAAAARHRENTTHSTASAQDGRRRNRG